MLFCLRGRAKAAQPVERSLENECGRDPLRPQFTGHCFTGDYPTQLTDTGGDTKV
jgi:hypothetical protein